MKTCPSCGKANAPAAKFCGGCGAPLASVPDIEPAVPAGGGPATGFPESVQSSVFGLKLPPPRVLLQIALWALAVASVGKLCFDVIGGRCDWWNWMTWLDKTIPLLSLGGFAVGCLFKNRIAATVSAVVPVCSQILLDLFFYVFVLPKLLKEEGVEFPWMRNFALSATNIAFFASLTLLAWVAVPHLVSILDEKLDLRRA